MTPLGAGPNVYDMTSPTATIVATYTDGTVANRGDVLIGADGQDYDYLSVAHAGNTWTKAQVYVRGTEVRTVLATFVGLTVRA